VRISIIIPTYNEAGIIAECIDAIYSQTRKPDEVIVVDDSTDSTGAVVRNLIKKHKGLKLARGEGNGVSAAKNLGAKAARGDVLIFLDADKSLERTALGEVERTFKNKSIELTAFSATKPEPKTFMEKCYCVRLLHSGRGEPGNADLLFLPEAFRRSTFMRIGMFDPSLRYFEDREIAARVAKLGIPIPRLKSKLYHQEPSTMNEFMKQAQWLGSSVTPRTARWRVRAIFYPLGPVYWVAFAFSLIAYSLHPIGKFAFAVMLSSLLFELWRCIHLSGLVLPSLAYVLALSPLRQLVIAKGMLGRFAQKLTP